MSRMVHFYFGNRQKAFETGLGTLIRAEGHSLKTKIIAFNFDFSWIEEIKENKHFDISIINLLEKTEFDMNSLNPLINLKNSVIFLVNIDLLLMKKQRIVDDLISLLENSKKDNEIIISSEEEIKALVSVADYVSEFSSF